MYHQISCFGDSNTYGYDPRAFGGDRYPADVRWTGLLASDLGIPVRNLGQNGRAIPRTAWELDRASLFPAGTDLAVIMLGSNDLLQQPGSPARAVSDRMEVFLRRLTVPVLLVAPPPMVPGAWVEDPRLPPLSRELADCYRELAGRLGIGFADAGEWGVELTFDGVHFSPVGHRAFARGLAAHLRKTAGT